MRSRVRVGQFEPKPKSYTPTRDPGRRAPGQNPLVGVVAPARTRSTWHRTVSSPLSQPQVPRSSLGTLPVRAFVGGDLMGSVVHRKTRGPLGGRQGFQFPGDEPRDPVNLA